MVWGTYSVEILPIGVTCVRHRLGELASECYGVFFCLYFAHAESVPTVLALIYRRYLRLIPRLMSVVIQGNSYDVISAAFVEYIWSCHYI